MATALPTPSRAARDFDRHLVRGAARSNHRRADASRTRSPPASTPPPAASCAPWARVDTPAAGGGSTIAMMHGRVFGRVKSVSAVRRIRPEFARRSSAPRIRASGAPAYAIAIPPLTSPPSHARHPPRRRRRLVRRRRRSIARSPARRDKLKHHRLPRRRGRPPCGLTRSPTTRATRRGATTISSSRRGSRWRGSIFYDRLDGGDVAADFAFTRAVGETFLGIYRTGAAERAARRPGRRPIARNS